LTQLSKRIFNKFHFFKQHTKYTINTCKPFKWLTTNLCFMAVISCFIVVFIILTRKEQPKDPSKLLSVPNFIKTKYTYSNNLKRFHLLSSVLMYRNHTIYTSIQKDVCFSSNKRKISAHVCWITYSREC
jgi:hypothetical protein